ncbi:MAG: DUF2088 domain-containing protein [Spirochaetia bacterium]|nr:DUF2088 domain-containing protein [Spirochaetia bacterium]
MSIYLDEGSASRVISQSEKELYLKQILAKLAAEKGSAPKRVLLIPPDITRFYSDSGNLSAIFYKLLSPYAHVDLLPALGTHVPMTEGEIRKMFGPDIPLDRFKIHDWRNDLKELGTVPGSFIKEISEGKVDYDIRIAINKILVEGKYDLIFSIGQIVPHEVIGMAGYTKNICIGVGGSDTINKSHFLGAVFGMERMMGHIDTPVRRALNKGYRDFIAHLPIIFLLTVMGKENGKMVMRGLYAGDEDASFISAAKLSQKVNLDLLDAPIKKAVVYLEPQEFKTTWLGNKAVYRLRMAMADGGELLILAPELHRFGEDKRIDELIRKYGYRGTPTTLKAVKETEDLKNNLSAAAHLIHGSSEGRFKIVYATGSHLTKQEVEGVGYEHRSYAEVSKIYNPEKLKDGWNEGPGGEKFFYVSNPALGLWALKKDFP